MNSYNEHAGGMLVEHKVALANADIQYFKDLVSVYEAGVKDMQLVNYHPVTPSVYVNYIDRTVDNLNDVTGNIEELDEFFSKVYNSLALSDRSITLPLMADNEIEKIRPDYLKNVSVVYNKELQNILAGKLKEGKIRAEYVSGAFFEKVKKQLVKTSLSEAGDVRELLKMGTPSIVRIDNAFIQNNLLPYVRSFEQNAKELTVLATNVKGALNFTYSDIQASTASVRELQKSGKLEGKIIDNLNLFKYNFIRGYFNLCAYISTMLIRKISCYTYNIMSYTNLENIIYNHFPDGARVLHENVMDGRLDDIDDTTLLNSMLKGNLSVVAPHIQSTIGKKKMELSTIMGKKYNYRLMYTDDLDSTQHPYDIYPYAAINQSIQEISDQMHQFDVRVQPDSLVDEIIDQSGLAETFMSKYENVLSRINNVSFYTNKIDTEMNSGGEVFLSLFNDISHYEKNVKIISMNVSRCYDFIESLQAKYRIADNDMDDVTHQEIVSSLNQFMKSFKDYILQITKKLLDRLDELTFVFNSVELPESDVEEDIQNPLMEATDYTDDILFEEYCNIETEEREILESLMKDYVKIKERKRRGVKVIFEETQPVDSKAVGAEAGPTAPKETPKEAVEKPENTQNQNQDKDKNENQTTDDKDAKQDSKNPKGVPASVREFLDQLKKKIDQFLANMKKATRRNINKGALEIENPIITIARYSKVTQTDLLREINAANNKIKALNEQNIPRELKGQRATAERYLFPDIPVDLGKKVDSFSKRVIHFYTFGNTQDISLIRYTGDDGKAKVQEMVDYCEGYNAMTTQVTNALEELSKSTMDKQTKMITSKKASGEEDSEAGTPVNRNDKMVNASTVLTSIVKDYYLAILTIMERKFMDYLKALNGLAPQEAHEELQEDKKEENQEAKKE